MYILHSTTYIEDMSLDLFNGLLNLIAAAHELSEFFPLFVELDSIGIAAQYEAI